MRLIDSHVHVQASAFESDVAGVISTARESGVERFLVPGWDAESSRRALAVSALFGLDAAAGIHPHIAAEATDEDWAAVVELAADPLTVAIGETGLDYDRGFSPRDVQLSNLRRHLVLSAEVDKPVIIHCRSKPGERDAQDDLLRELAAAGAPRALLHSFSGPVDYAERALEMGLAVSFSGLAFRVGEEATGHVARLTPSDRVLVETDSPYLSPPGAPERRNEPIWVSVTARWLAEARGMSEEELGQTLVANYDRIFSRRPS
jgi:TatD DNase family protein